jgi:hypothetical protein
MALDKPSIPGPVFSIGLKILLVWKKGIESRTMSKWMRAIIKTLGMLPGSLNQPFMQELPVLC